jgi:hypothetical protein
MKKQRWLVKMNYRNTYTVVEIAAESAKDAWAVAMKKNKGVVCAIKECAK